MCIETVAGDIYLGAPRLQSNPEPMEDVPKAAKGGEGAKKKEEDARSFKGPSKGSFLKVCK